MIKTAGQQLFRRLPGTRGPYADPVTGIMRLEEMWEGPVSIWPAFAALLTKKSPHPAYPTLGLDSAEPTRQAGSIMQVRMVYAGLLSPITAPTKRFQKLLKTESTTGRRTRRFQRVVSQTITVGGTTSLWGPASQTVDGDVSYSYYTPTYTYRYASQTEVKNPQFGGLATVDLAGQNPQIFNKTFRASAPWPALPPEDEYRDLEIIDTSPAVQQTPRIVATDLICEERGLAWEVEETWEIQLV